MKTRIIPVSQLKAYAEYQEAETARAHLFMGRADIMTELRQLTQYTGRLLNPERRGEEWCLERNMAFFAGAIASGKQFKILSSLESIHGRAKFGLQCRYGFGGTVKELLWLEDNDYTFEPDLQDENVTWAIPPRKNKYAEPLIIDYKDNTFADDAEKQVQRIGAITRQVAEQRLHMAPRHADSLMTKTGKRGADNQAKNKLKLFDRATPAVADTRFKNSFSLLETMDDEPDTNSESRSKKSYSCTLLDSFTESDSSSAKKRNRNADTKKLVNR